MSEGGALRLITCLLEHGYLGRVRRCRQCEKWLYAKVHHQEFCSFGCQQKHYRSSPHGKERRREYMRDYRMQYTSSLRAR